MKWIMHGACYTHFIQYVNRQEESTVIAYVVVCCNIEHAGYVKTFASALHS